MAHITRSAAEARLSSRYDLDIELLDAHVEMAEQSLRSMGPFSGNRYDASQPDLFPRTAPRDGDTPGVVPGAVLDYLALRAAYIATYDETTPVTSHSLSGVGSRSYARPKTTKLETYEWMAAAAIGKYQRHIGVMR